MKTRGVGARELERRSDLNQSTISRLARGVTESPDPALLDKLAELLEVEPAWLAFGRGAMGLRKTARLHRFLNDLNEEEVEKRKIIAYLHEASRGVASPDMSVKIYEQAAEIEKELPDIATQRAQVVAEIEAAEAAEAKDPRYRVAELLKTLAVPAAFTGIPAESFAEWEATNPLVGDESFDDAWALLKLAHARWLRQRERTS